MIARVVVVLLAVVGASCTSAQVMRADTITRPPTAADRIVFLTETPTKPFTVIATVTVSDDGNGSDIGKRLRQEAAKLGGEAILIVGANQSTMGGVGIGGGLLMGLVVPVKEQTARIIVFTPGGDTPIAVNTPAPAPAPTQEMATNANIPTASCDDWRRARLIAAANESVHHLVTATTSAIRRQMMAHAPSDHDIDLTATRLESNLLGHCARRPLETLDVAIPAVIAAHFTKDGL